MQKYKRKTMISVVNHISATARLDQLQQMRLMLSLVAVDFSTSSSSQGCDLKLEPVWQLMPEDLVETVLLFLPWSSQARFRSVCKRWRTLMTSRAFLEQTWSSIGSRLMGGEPLCIVENVSSKITGRIPVVPSWAERCPQLQMKHVEIDIPSRGPLSACWRGDEMTKVLSHGGLLAVAYFIPLDEDGDVRICQLRCWVLNSSNQTCREVPPPPVTVDIYNYQPIGDYLNFNYLNLSWNMWLVRSSNLDHDENFELFLMLNASIASGRRPGATFYTYCSTTAQWGSTANHDSEPQVTGVPELCALSKGGCLVVPSEDNRVWRSAWHDGSKPMTPIAEPPVDGQGQLRLLSHPDLDLVMGYVKKVNMPPDSCALYRLDESCNQWKDVLANSLWGSGNRLPQELINCNEPQDGVFLTTIRKAHPHRRTRYGS